MGVFVFEIEGLRIAAYGDIDRIEAEEWVDEEAFKSDLICREYNGRPLWNGESAIHVREASLLEIAKWKASRDRALEEGDIDDLDEDWLVFLVPATHSADDDDKEQDIPKK